MDPDDHALVELLAGRDEQPAALLQVEQRVGDRLAALVAHQHAIVAIGNLALHRRKTVEDVTHEAGAAGEGEELALEADQAARRHAVLEARAPQPEAHVGQVRAALAERLHHRALVRLLDIHGEGFVGLVHLAVHHPGQHLRARHGELIALAAHVLDEDGQVQLPAPGDPQYVRLVGVFHAQRHVALQLAVQPLAQLPAGDELALAPGERRGVDLEVHRQRRLIHADGRQPERMLRVADRHADVDGLDAGDGDDVAGARLFHRVALEAGEGQHLADPGEPAVGIAKAQRHALAGAHHAAANAADADAPDVGVVVEGRDLQLQRQVGLRRRRRHVGEDRLEQRRHVGAALGVVGARPALQRRGVDDREVELRVAGAELVEQVEGLVDDPRRAAPGPVDLVDHHDGLQTLGERLARDEACLRHRSLDRIDQQQHAVHHGQHPLDFPAEVGVPGGIDDVDARAAILDGAVLGEDGNATLALDVVGIHDALAEPLVGGKGARLLQQAVDQRGLAVVDVRDDGDVADRRGRRAHEIWFSSSKVKKEGEATRRRASPGNAMEEYLTASRS